MTPPCSGSGGPAPILSRRPEKSLRVVGEKGPVLPAQSLLPTQHVVSFSFHVPPLRIPGRPLPGRDSIHPSTLGHAGFSFCGSLGRALDNPLNGLYDGPVGQRKGVERRTVKQKRRPQERQEILRQLARKGDTAPLRLWLRRHLKAAPSGTADHWADLLQAVLLDLRRMPEADATCLHRAVDVFMEAAKEEGLSAESVLKTAVVDLMGRVAPDKAGRTGTPTDTRDRILEAALEVFSEKGFHHATMDEIADRAGVGKGTVYRYFSSKDNLFSQLVQARLQELEQEAEQVLDSDDHVLSMIEKYLGLYFAFFDRNQRLYRVMVQEHPEMDDRLQDLYVEEIMRRIPRLKRKIYEARYRGVLKDVNFQTVFYGVMGFIHGVIQRWLAHDCAYSLEQELPTVKEVLFYGFVNKENNTNTGG